MSCSGKLITVWLQPSFGITHMYTRPDMLFYMCVRYRMRWTSCLIPCIIFFKYMYIFLWHVAIKTYLLELSPVNRDCVSEWNLSIHKKTFASPSTSGSFRARAVDGIRNIANVRECYSSNTDVNIRKRRYWMVDLAGVYKVTYVKITSRVDCCGQLGKEYLQSCAWSVRAHAPRFCLCVQSVARETLRPCKIQKEIAVTGKTST